MDMFRIKVDLVFFTWDELLEQNLETALIMYNRKKPWNGFTMIAIENKSKDCINVVAPRSTAFNHFGIYKKDYGVDYFITNDLMWHRLSESTEELDYEDVK